MKESVNQSALLITIYEVQRNIMCKKKGVGMDSNYQKCLLDNIGFTPLVQLRISELPKLNVYAKLEFYNPTGSIKDRAASHIIDTLLRSGEIDHDTTIIESTSGNFGIALSAYCRKNGLKFIAVVDPNITNVNEMLIRSYGAQIVKVTNPDTSGGYLLSRIAKVKEIQQNLKKSYWVNQYGNPLNANAYYKTIGQEICDTMDRLDYIFVGVSSGGTITGVSQKIRENYPDAKIIAVDIEGSVIFGGAPKKRYIPGIGSSMCPEIIKKACIDEHIMIAEKSTVEGCKELLRTHNIFAGGSSGSAYAAIKRYFSENRYKEGSNVLTIFADRGERYIDTVYNEKWCSSIYGNEYKEA